MLNKIILQGRMVNDPQIRTTQSGANCGSFAIACERNHKDASGQKPVDFIDCVVWNKTADFLARYFHKGDSILLEGNLYIRRYVDKEGNNRRAAEVNVSDVFFPGSKKESAFTELSDDGDTPFDVGDDDIPF